MARQPFREEGTELSFGRCGPPPAPGPDATRSGAASPAQAPETHPRRPVAPAGGYTPGIGALIPPEWVGLTEGETPTWPSWAAAAAISSASQDPGTPSPVRAASVIASVSQAVLEHVTPVTEYLERGGCVVEPGKPCASSGRCRERGY